jgi:hypothetical protein
MARIRKQKGSVRMKRGDEQYTKLWQSISGILTTLVGEHGFTTPIGVLVEGANGYKLTGHYRWAEEHEGLDFVEEKSRSPVNVFRLPIDIEFQDGGSRRVAGVRIEWDESPGRPDVWKS